MTDSRGRRRMEVKEGEKAKGRVQEASGNGEEGSVEEWK